MKRAKCWLGLWLAVGLTTLMPLPSALGETETVGGVTWIYLVEDGKATVTGATPASETMTIPSKLGGCAVTEIGYQAFQKNTKITVLSIPDSVKNIGEFAFYRCTELQAVTIGNSVTNIGKAAFRACYSLSSLSLGKSVVRIGVEAFDRCTKLTVVKIPDSVKDIGGSAFYSCSGLTSVAIPDSVGSIGDEAFEHCTGLTSVTIGNSVTSIGDYAFRYCSGLTSVTLPDSVTSIGQDAFRSCSGLTSVTIGNSVTNIGGYAFAYCSGLTSVTIPDSVTSIGDGVFSDCSELNTLYVPASWKGTSMLDYAGVPEDCTVVYVVKEQSVTFDANGGTCGTSSRIYAVGQTYSSFPAATRERYAFAGWWTEPTGGQRVLESDTVQAIETRTLYAHWTWLMAEQEVTFNPNGGICDTATKTYSVGGKYTPLPVAVSVREHYAFAGWWTSAEGGEQVTNTSTVTAAETRMLYAHWTLAEQVVTFNANGGTCEVAQEVFVIGKAYGTLPLATMPHYTFEGWWTAATGGEQVTDSSAVSGTETRTLYAHWTLAEQVVTFIANGGNCDTAQGVYAIGKTYGSLPAATKDRYAFAGWWTKATGGEQVTVSSVVTESETRTLYAHWKVPPARMLGCTTDVEAGNCTVRFTGQADVTYALQCRQKLEGNEGWTTVATKMAEKDGTITITAKMPEGWTSGFYRVVVVGAVQLWAGGPYWADRNVGAATPWESGLYFWWGDTVGYWHEGGTWMASDGSDKNFSFNNRENTPTCDKDRHELWGWLSSAYMWVGLAPEHDAAQARWGGGWCMPTDEDFDALNNNCDWTWTATNGVSGFVICGKGDYADNSIFLPAAGRADISSLFGAGVYGEYWSTVPIKDSRYYSTTLCFSPTHHETSGYDRSGGLSIRPVRWSAE